MNFNAYFTGFWVTSAILLIEHILCARRLLPTGQALDWHLFARYVLGVSAILAGCAVVRAYEPNADPLLTPIACSAAGGLLTGVALVRWLLHKALDEAETRGWLKGLADKE